MRGWVWLLISAAVPPGFSQSLFEGHSDVGTVLHAGSMVYDEAAKAYTVAGSGENMWFHRDDFHFAWRKVTEENISLAADIAILGAGGDHHRKAVLMMRQSLDGDAAYADAAVHGDGLTSLQFRDAQGATTHEIESSASGPRRVRLEKRGDRFYLWISGSGQELQFAGGSTRVALQAPFYIGIGVCAHNKDAVEKAAFTNVELSAMPGYSTIETISVTSTDARVSYVSRERIEGAAYSADGAFLVFHAGSSPMRVATAGGTAEPVHPVEMAGTRLSPDGKLLAVTTNEGGEMVLGVVSVADGTLKVLARIPGGQGSVSAHPWSPDSKRLVFVTYQAINGKPS